MKRVIDGITYDTDKARLLARSAWGDSALFETNRGRYFVGPEQCCSIERVFELRSLGKYPCRGRAASDEGTMRSLQQPKSEGVRTCRSM
jgi:hypothetical protein